MAQALTIGTSGHVDLGKTALVRALTGVDTDRLQHERERGLSIELGFARLDLGDARWVSLIDVPGHERFIRTMVAGATGIDMYLLTVAADDGVMPQTHEHLAVLRALGVTSGVVAITKADLTDPARAAEQISHLLPGAVPIPCSARTGAGIEAVRMAISELAQQFPPSDRDLRPAVLHIDRVFTIRGAGSVITGTLWSGTLRSGNVVNVFPAGSPGRIRAIQVHGTRVKRAVAGQRVAVNLAGLRRSELQPGMVLGAPHAALAPAWIIDASLQLSRTPTGRVIVHHGTRHTRARLVQLNDDQWQMRCDAPLMARSGDRLVVRSLSPPDTLGGGRVIDPHARRRGPNSSPLVTARQRPRAHLAMDHQRSTPTELSREALELEHTYRRAGYEPPLDNELGAASAHLVALRAAGRLERLGPRMHAHGDVLAAVRQRVGQLIERNCSITLSGLRDELGTSRKYAQALLDHCDAAKLTRRLPDNRRVLRSR